MYELKNNIEQAQYEFHIDEHIAKVSYEIVNDAVYLPHTNVPKPLEGKGIASALVKAVLDDIEQQGLKIYSERLCSFIAVYIRRHKHYQKLLLT